jgi:hypothetical protein
MSRYLVNFGDSWAHGCGTRVRPFNLQYSAQLSSTTNRSLLDLSQPSTSAGHMVLQFRRFIQEYYQPGHDYLALFFITAQERQLTFDHNGAVQEIHPNGPSWKQYYQTVYTDQLGEFLLNTIILTLQTMARYYQIDDRYLLGWQQPTLWPEIDCNKFYNQAQTTVMSLLGSTNIVDCRNNEPNFILHDGHPSVAGHTVIAQTLYPWIS